MMMLIDPFRFGPSGPASIEYLGAYEADSVSGNTAHFVNVDLGDEHPFRTIVFAVHWASKTTAASAVSATAGGEASLVIAGDSVGPDFSSQYLSCAIFSAPVPTGESGEITVTFSKQQVTSFVYVYRVIGLQNQEPVDTDKQTSFLVTVTSNCDVRDGGVLVAACTTRLAADQHDYSGATKAYDLVGLYSGGSLESSANETNHAVTVTRGGFDAGGPFDVLITASFR